MTDWLAIHGGYVTPVAVGTIALMVLANLVLCAVMLQQRPWRRSERAMFWFLVGKVAFWGRVLTWGSTWHPIQPYTTERVGLLLVLAATSVYLTYALAGRYLLGWEDAP